MLSFPAHSLWGFSGSNSVLAFVPGVDLMNHRDTMQATCLCTVQPDGHFRVEPRASWPDADPEALLPQQEGNHPPNKKNGRFWPQSKPFFICSSYDKKANRQRLQCPNGPQYNSHGEHFGRPDFKYILNVKTLKTRVKISVPRGIIYSNQI
jgi:hypothetical protein